MSMKNSNDTIENRSRDLPVCSAVPQPLRYRVPPKVHYRIHNCPPPVSILSQPNPVHTATSLFHEDPFYIILPSTPGSPHWSLSLGFTHQNPVHASPLPHPRYMFRPSRFYHPHNIG